MILTKNHQEVSRIKKEGGILYFIEDTKTNLWYCLPDDYFEPRIHTFGQGWNRPYHLREDFWTNNPQVAGAFYSKEEAGKYSKMMLKTNDSHWQDYVNGEFIEKSIKITEHEFINS